MVAIKNVLLFVAAASAAILPRDFSTVQKDLQTINNDTITLTNAANTYNGGISNSIPVQNAYSQLDKDVNQATKDAQATTSVTDAQAKSLITYITNTLEPNVNKSVTAIQNKKAQFKADGLSSTVLSDLKTLKNDTTTLGNALVAKAGSANQANAQTALNKVLADIQAGINTFSS